MKQDMITVVVKRVGEPAVVQQTRNTLKAFQELVGGYIETFRIAEDLVLVVNEEGLMEGLPWNCKVCAQPFVGTVVAVATDQDEFASIPERFIPLVLSLFEVER